MAKSPASRVLTTFHIHFQNLAAQGEISVRDGKVHRLVAGMNVSVAGNLFKSRGKGGAVVTARIASSAPARGPRSPIVQIQFGEVGFSFFLRDLNRDFPIFIPDFQVAIVPEEDHRDYAAIELDIRSRGFQTSLQKIESEPEETFENAAPRVRNLVCPIWLGIAGDVRIFELDLEFNGQWDHFVAPRFHNLPVKLAELGDQPVRHNFMIGRGVGVTRDITRHIEDGALPILHFSVIDEDVRYDCTAFVSLERANLTPTSPSGTHYLVADACHFGTRLSDEQKAIVEKLSPAELHQDDETVLYFRCIAINPSQAPRYAFFRSAVAAKAATWTTDPKALNGVFTSGRVFAIQKLDGNPMPSEEMAVLLFPGQSCTFEFYIPHEPISAGRAKGLFKQDFDRRHQECRKYWLNKLASAGQIHIPEPRIQQMLRAGLLHLDLISHGKAGDGPLGVNVGRYGPIGTETSTLIQYFESMGWHKQSQRAIEYFLAKQQTDGFIQNYETIMTETAPVLWAISQHYRYTRDEAWLKKIKPNMIKACDFLIAWHKRNCRDELKGRGYGMLDGKVADPEDPYRLFMLNGYTCLGLHRAAEMLQLIDPAAATAVKRQANHLTKCVREAFFQAVGRSPVIPMGDGTWSPTVGPWAEATGPVCLYADDFNAYTHASFVSRDSLVGALYLIFQEVIAPNEPAADWLMKFHAELMTQRNAAFSEPYYTPYLYVHLLRGEVKQFLKGYYNTFAALADRETYTFWEHLFQASVHKTSEEGWFLMQTRWMLYLENGDTLELLKGIPRRWMEDGKRIELKGVKTYFGKLDLVVESDLTGGIIRARIDCQGKLKPKKIRLRLPHPQGRRPASVTGGVYEHATETVRIDAFKGIAEISARF